MTIQALAGVLGGTQSLHTNSFDEALALPSEEAVRVALRTQQIIAEESGAADIVDPLGGSFAVEALTDDIEAQVMAYIEHIKEELGDGSVRDGVLEGIEQGYFQREIQDSAYEYQERVERDEEVVVGVNAYTVAEETEPELLRVDESVQQRQRERLARVKAERDDDAVAADLEALRERVDQGDNVVPAIVDAVKDYATMGEIMAVFEAAYGSYTETAGVV